MADIPLPLPPPRFLGGRNMQSERMRAARCTLLGEVPPAVVVDIPELDSKTAAKLKAIEQGEMQAELKHIDRKYTKQGHVYYSETVDEVIPEQINWWSKFAICMVRYISNGQPSHVQKVSLQVNSPHLKAILKATVKEFPGVSFQTKDITIDAPYRVLFHCRHDLEHAGRDLESGSEAAEHLNLLLAFIREQFKETIEESDNLLEQGLIDYQYLWTIFRPGTTIYAPISGQPRAFTLNSYGYSCDPPALNLTLEYVDFDGKSLGTRTTGHRIPAFSGAERINKLSAYPISWHPNVDGMRMKLIDRGRRFESLAGMSFHCYNGVGIEHGALGPSKYNVTGRVVIDTKTVHRLKANLSFSVTPFKPNEEMRPKRRHIGAEAEDGETFDLVPAVRLELDLLTEEQCLRASAMTRGFSFTEKKWFDFFVDLLSSADWNPDCFDQLVLPNAQKQLVRALVTTHTQQHPDFDDIIKGKGRGLIMVLHGPPGVGKTLSAETVAEYCQRPLYMVSSGDLGTNSSTLDERLSRILDMASTWKAVLLIDEADVFLERRSLHDMERNSLVSIFLRVLEYYEGILFLTSNRVSTFDDAFKSRIHVPLKYNDLSVVARKQIWRNFLTRKDTAAAGSVHIDEAGYESLAQANINGRQIKNVIRTAKSLAQYAGEALDLAKLQQVIAIQMEFERELGSGTQQADQTVNGS